MPKVSGKVNKEKLAKVYKICNGMQKRNHMSDQKKENCIMGISKRWGLIKGRSKKKKK